MIKILFVGEGRMPMYELAFYKASLSINGLKPYIYTWKDEIVKLRCNLMGRVENKLGVGKIIDRINEKLVELSKNEQFDIIFLYSCRVLYPKTVRKLKATGAYIAIYNNDNPFSNMFPYFYWRHWRGSLKYGDCIYVYRKENIKDCVKRGFSKVKLLRSYYNPDRLYCIEDEKIYIDIPDVLFLGHYENDERTEYIKYLANNGISVGIPSLHEWDGYEEKNQNVVRLHDCHLRYNEYLNKTKICLVFLSKINHDTYTRRCFEIPAVKTLMMSTYTEDIASMFEENKEAIYFRNKKELLEKIRYYLANERERLKVADAGYKRVMKDKHSSIDRVYQILEDYMDYTERF